MLYIIYSCSHWFPFISVFSYSGLCSIMDEQNNDSNRTGTRPNVPSDIQSTLSHGGMQMSDWGNGSDIPLNHRKQLR